MASFTFWFLFPQHCYSPLETGIGTAFFGNMGIQDGHVDTHWAGPSLEKHHELRHTASNYFFWGEKPRYFAHPVNHVDGGPAFPRVGGLCPDRLVFLLLFFSFYLLTFGSNDSELMIENTFSLSSGQEFN